jgi:hypothetical protein
MLLKTGSCGGMFVCVFTLFNDAVSCSFLEMNEWDGSIRGMTVAGGGGRSAGTNRCHSATVSTTNLTWTDLGPKLCPRGDKSAVNRLLHGKVCSILWQF